jgi:hypothetical protein
MREALLQRALGDLILDASDAAFRGEAAGFGAGLAGPDVDSFVRQRERFLLYRELARNNLLAPLENTFPVLRALLGPDAWGEATAAFLAARSLASPYYRDIAPAFAAWLVETGWGQARWPAILELAHYECLELLVTRGPDEAVPLDPSVQVSADASLVLDASVRVVSYRHAVHRATEAEPEPRAEATHLLLHRDPEGGFGVLELTAATAALLAATVPLGQSLAGLGLVLDGPLLDLFDDLRARGALLGFRR